jgi:hypothetical protein
VIDIVPGEKVIAEATPKVLTDDQIQPICKTCSYSIDSFQATKWQQPKSPENGPRSSTPRFSNGPPKSSLLSITWPTSSEESYDPANPAIMMSIPSSWMAQVRIASINQVDKSMVI